MPLLAKYIADARSRFQLAFRNRGLKRLRCFLEPEAWRSSVRDLYWDLQRTGRTKKSRFEDADIAFIQKDHYQAWHDRRQESGSTVALSQLPHVSSLMVRKAPLAELIKGRPYAPETFIDVCDGQKRGIWVQKPSVGGRGSDISFLRDPCDWREPGYVLQRYIETPFLIEDRKFDVRVIAKINDQGELRHHPDGLIRCAYQPFDRVSLDPRIHNSNHGFQEKEGLDLVAPLFVSRSPLADGTMEHIDAIVADVCRLLHERDVFRGTRDFEMLGFDFLVDDTRKVWLTEINQHLGWNTYQADIRQLYLDALDSLFDFDLNSPVNPS